MLLLENVFRGGFVLLHRGLPMDEQRVHVYMPSMDGEYVPVKFTSPAEDLKDTEVLIFLDEGGKHIYIWTGENSSVRKRFISSQIARQMRLEKGMTHRISTEDQGNETVQFNEFIDNLGETPVSATTPLEVTPPVAAATVYETPAPKIDKKSTVIKKTPVEKKTLKKEESFSEKSAINCDCCFQT